MLITFLAAVVATELCGSSSTLVSVTVETINDYIGKERPVFLRMIFSGCEYAPESYKGWQAAAEMYPQIAFIELDCLKDATGLQVCGQYQAQAEGREFVEGTASPYHVLFNAFETKAIQNSGVSRGSVDGDPNVFVEKITQHLKLGHVEYLKMLTSESTDEFIKATEYTAMILYNSNCGEDATFVGDWATAASQDLAPIPPDTANIRYGRLDCALFPEECQRWSSATPAVVFHKRKNEGVYASVTKMTSQNPAKIVQEAQAELDSMTGASLPEPSEKTPSPPETPEDDSQYKTINNEGLEARTIEEVKGFYADYKSEFEGTAWTGDMNELAKCVIGTSDPKDREQGTTNVNIVRKLAGVDPVVLNDEKYLQGCQRTALVLHKIGYITHYPNVDRTDVCIEGNKDMVAEYAEKSNLAQNCASATKSVGLFMEDLGEENAQALGHRRWILNPNVKDIGFGLAPQRSYPRGTTTSGLEINDARPSIVVMRIVTSGDEPYDKVNFISWPSAGPFPSDQVPPIWHVSCSLFRDTSITKDDVKIKVTREDGQTIPVTAHFFNRQYMGTPDALIMQMDEHVKEICSTGHTIHVEIWVTNKKQKIDYRFRLFDMQTEVKLCLYNTQESECSEYVNKYGPGSFSDIATAITESNAGRADVYVSEDVTGDLDFSTLENVRVLIHGAKVNGQVTIGASGVVEIADPSTTTVIVNWDLASGKAGLFTTATKPQQLQVKVSTIPQGREAAYSRVDVYKGAVTPILFTGDGFSGEIQDYEAGYLFFGAYVNGSTMGVSLSYLKLILVLRSGNCDGSATEDMENAIVIDVAKDGLGKNMDKKKLVKWYICDASVTRIEPSFFPTDRYQDYEITTAVSIGESARTITLIYDPIMEKTVRSLTIKDLRSDSNSNKFDIQTSDNTWIVRHKALTIGYTEIKNGTGSQWDSLVSIPYLTDASSSQAKQYLKQPLKSYKDTDSKSCSHNADYDAQLCEFDPTNSQEASVLWYRFETSGTYDRVVSRLSQYDYKEFADKGGVRPHQFIPAQGTESKKIHLRAEGGLTRVVPQGPYLVPYVDLDPSYSKPIIPMIVENYQDITLEVNGDLLQNITYMNVGKVTLDLGGKKTYDSISVTEPGTWSSYLSSLGGIEVTTLTISADATVQAEKAEATNLVTNQATCAITGLTSTSKWELTDSYVTLTGATITSDVKVKRIGRFPRVVVTDGDSTTFNPKSIEYDMGYSKSLLELVTETTTLVSGISQNVCQSIVGKVTLVNAPQFRAVCGGDGSLQITRTTENGKNEDIGSDPSTPEIPETPEEVTNDTIWESPSDVPANIKIESEVTLSVANGENFEVVRVEVGSSGKVTAKNMVVTTELQMAGGASLSAVEGSKITITDKQTQLKLSVQDGMAPSLNLGEIGQYSAVPAAITIQVDEKVTGPKSLIKGRTLNCEDWLQTITAAGANADEVLFRCEKTQEQQSKILSSVLDEWAVIMDGKTEGGDPNGGLPPGAVAAIVIVVLLVVGAAVGGSVFLIRRRGQHFAGEAMKEELPQLTV